MKYSPLETAMSIFSPDFLLPLKLNKSRKTERCRCDLFWVVGLLVVEGCPSRFYGPYKLSKFVVISYVNMGRRSRRVGVCISSGEAL